jgi:hypothetical protein
MATGAPLTIEQLLELHPFPAEFAQAKRIERLWTFDLPGTPAELWPFLSDTSRMNRALGTAEMTFVERDGRRFGSAKPGGVLHEWVEVPWNWVAEQWLTSTRIYERGFMKVVYAIHRLEPIETGTRVYLYFGTVPRNALWASRRSRRPIAAYSPGSPHSSTGCAPTCSRRRLRCSPMARSPACAPSASS